MNGLDWMSIPVSVTRRVAAGKLTDAPPFVGAVWNPFTGLWNESDAAFLKRITESLETREAT